MSGGNQESGLARAGQPVGVNGVCGCGSRDCSRCTIAPGHSLINHALALAGRHKPGSLSEFSVTGPDPIRQLWTPVAHGPVGGAGLGRNISQLAHMDGANLVWWPIVLAVASIPYGVTARLRGFRQYLTIGGIFDGSWSTAAEREAVVIHDEPYLIEKEVTTPTWSFQDGGVRWHISHMGGRATASGLRAPAAAEDPRGLLPVLGLGQFFDIRAPWKEMSPGYDAVFEGRDVIVMWAEVLQTDPATRPRLGARLNPTELALVTPEDAFVSTSESKAKNNDPTNAAVFWRIAGSLIVQFDTE